MEVPKYELLQNIIFINLDHRTDRLVETLDEFKALNIGTGPLEIAPAPQRFSAIKMDTGAIGCTLSHIKCLELALERKYPYVFICEDDIKFLSPTKFLRAIAEFESNTPPLWNVFIIGGNAVPPYRQYNNTCIQTVNCQTTTGYITHYDYYTTLIENYKEGLRLLLNNPGSQPINAIDQYWKHLQVLGGWYLLYPASVVQRISYSDIEKRQVDYAWLMLDLEKKYLFNEPNVKMNFSL